MAFGKVLGCHQKIAHSFVVKGFQFPVCARCTGVIIGYFIGFFTYFYFQIPLYLIFTLAGIMLFDWSLQYFKILHSTNFRRLLTGLGCGFAFGNSYIWAIKDIFNFLFNLIL